MRSKILLKLSVLAGGLAGIIFLAMIVFFTAFYLPGRGFDVKSDLSARLSEIPVKSDGNRDLQYPGENKAAGSFVLSEQARPALPVRLKIPRIKVDAGIEYVGFTPDGAMDIPKGPDNVGWLDIWPRPGEIGNAVIAGHYGTKNGKGSVFDELYKLRKGDELYIEDEKGEEIVFVVRESRRYDSNADASRVFGSDDGKAHLNLITCEGNWNKTAKSYSSRLVVFADKK